MQELKELTTSPSPHFTAAPLDDDLFHWHFTVRGPPGTAFEGGRYHGRLLLPPEYPFKPPNIILLTPSGRFETNTKICLTITGYHPEYWQPAWGIQTAMIALISVFPSKGEGAIGALEWSDEERKAYAKASAGWKCEGCGVVLEEELPGEAAEGIDAEAVPEGMGINYERDIKESETEPLKQDESMPKEEPEGYYPETMLNEVPPAQQQPRPKEDVEQLDRLILVIFSMIVLYAVYKMELFQ